MMLLDTVTPRIGPLGDRSSSTAHDADTRPMRTSCAQMVTSLAQTQTPSLGAELVEHQRRLLDHERRLERDQIGDVEDESRRGAQAFATPKRRGSTSRRRGNGQSG